MWAELNYFDYVRLAVLVLSVPAGYVAYRLIARKHLVL
jgi:hypothetical protein